MSGDYELGGQDIGPKSAARDRVLGVELFCDIIGDDTQPSDLKQANRDTTRSRATGGAQQLELQAFLTDAAAEKGRLFVYAWPLTGPGRLLAVLDVVAGSLQTAVHPTNGLAVANLFHANSATVVQASGFVVTYTGTNHAVAVLDVGGHAWIEVRGDLDAAGAPACARLIGVGRFF